MPETQCIQIPVLSNIKYHDINSQMLQLIEEVGELGQAVNILLGTCSKRKCNLLTPEEALLNTTEEVFDVLQTAIGILAILKKVWGVDVGIAMERHVDKLIERGYLNLDTAQTEVAATQEVCKVGS